MRFMLPRKARCRRTVDYKCFLHERLIETEHDAHEGNATGLSTERKE